MMVHLLLGELEGGDQRIAGRPRTVDNLGVRVVFVGSLAGLASRGCGGMGSSAAGVAGGSVVGVAEGV